MKIISSLLLFFTLLLSNITTAQYGNGYGNNGYGNGRRMNSMQQDMPQSKPKETPPEETVAKIMEQMQPALQLDALQSVAISNILIQSINTQGILMKNENIGQEAKMEELKSISENTNKKINELLNADQREKYTAYLVDNKNFKKSRKNKKRK